MNSRSEILKVESEKWVKASEPYRDKLKKLCGESLHSKVDDALNSAFLIHCQTGDGVEMLQALTDEERLPLYPKDESVLSSRCLFKYLESEGSVLGTNNTFKRFAITLYQLNNKGTGKAELLCSSIWRGALPPSAKEIDCAFFNIPHVEVKADNASIKGVANNSSRTLDSFLGKNFDETKYNTHPGQFSTDDINIVTEMLDVVYCDFIKPQRDRIIKCYERTKDVPEEKKVSIRKNRVAFEVLRFYKAKEKAKSHIFLKNDVKKSPESVSFCIINDITEETKETICELLSFKPQMKRTTSPGRRGNQAVGDGYSDAVLKI